MDCYLADAVTPSLILEINHRFLEAAKICTQNGTIWGAIGTVADVSDPSFRTDRMLSGVVELSEITEKFRRLSAWRFSGLSK
jgi:hypothetical protein